MLIYFITCAVGYSYALPTIKNNGDTKEIATFADNIKELTQDEINKRYLYQRLLDWVMTIPQVKLITCWINQKKLWNSLTFH